MEHVHQHLPGHTRTSYDVAPIFLSDIRSIKRMISARRAARIFFESLNPGTPIFTQYKGFWILIPIHGNLNI